MSPKVKPWLVLATIFLAGIATGVALSIVLEPQFERLPGPMQMQGDFMAFLTRKLNLTPDQQVKIQPVIAEAAKNIQTLHRDEMDNGAKIIQASDDQISVFLTPEQKATLAQMEIERKKMFLRHLRTWGPPREGDGQGGPGDDMPPPSPPGEEAPDAGSKATPPPASTK